MKKKRLLSMLLAATLLFSLTACARTDNGEEPSDEQPSQGTTSQAPADPMEVSQGVTDDTIKIGTISLVRVQRKQRGRYLLKKILRMELRLEFLHLI